MVLKKIFNQFSVVFLALIILSNAQSYTVHLAFDLNKELIIEQLCENKDKPEMQCNGKCYLSKQINQTENHSNKDQFSQIIFLNLPETETQLHAFFTSRDLFIAYQQSIFNIKPDIVVPPPRISVS